MTADEVSEKSGFDVYVPDILDGDPIPSSLLKDMPHVPGEKRSIGAKVSDRKWIHWQYIFFCGKA
jgi:hypothetical protein